MTLPLQIDVFLGRDDPQRFADVLALRMEVFVVEQQVPYDEEVDGLDDDALHVALRDDRVVGTARLRVLGDVAKIERVAVSAARRGTGLGRKVMDAIEAEARARGCAEGKLAAQVQVIPFYERLGYVAEGPVFLDANIDHRWMRKRL